MDIENKQWKKLFANKYLLSIFSISILLIAFLFVNFLLNTFINVADFVKFFREKGFETGSPLTVFNWKWLFHVQIQFLYVYIFVFVLVGFKTLLKVHEIHESFKDINKGTKGTARWTTVEEIKETYKAVKDNDEEYKGIAGIPVVHYGDELFVDTNNTNVAVIASTQTGKTELFSYPLLDLTMRAEIKDSLVITDIKGDMLKNTRDEFEKYGYVVHVFNLLNPDQSIAYNPLELIKQAYFKGDYTKAQMLCNALSYSLFHNPNAKDPLWEEASIALLNSLILAVCDISMKSKTPEKITMYTVTIMLSSLGANPDEEGLTKLDYFFGSLDVNHPARLQYSVVEFSKGVTRASIFTGTLAKLKNYLYDSIAKLTAMHTFNVEDLAFSDKPVALFIVYPDWDDSNYSIISTFLSQTAAVLSEKATLTKNSKLPRRVRFLYEEVANIPAIEGINRSLAVGLSRGLVYCLVLQNKAQMAEKYGKDMAESIFGNCGNQIYIMSDELEDAEDFSKKLGDKTVVVNSRSGQSLDLDKSSNESEEARPLMYPHELRKLKKGEWIFIRTKKREDNENKRITAFPIFASIETRTQMLHRYEYLMHRFNNPIAFEDMNLEGAHKDINLNNLLISFDFIDKLKEQEELVDVDSEEYLDIEPEQSENVDLDDFLYSEFEEDTGGIMAEIEPVYHDVTPIFEVISTDKYNFIKSVASQNLSEEEFNYFEGLDSVEELRTFFLSPDRIDKFKVIEGYLV